MSKYLLHGKLTAKPNQRNELAAILLEASKLVSTAKGCQLYVIGLDENDTNSVFVTEIWDEKEDHDNSLNVIGVRSCLNLIIQNCYDYIFCQLRRILKLLAALLPTKNATQSDEK